MLCYVMVSWCPTATRMVYASSLLVQRRRVVCTHGPWTRMLSARRMVVVDVWACKGRDDSSSSDNGELGSGHRDVNVNIYTYRLYVNKVIVGTRIRTHAGTHMYTNTQWHSHMHARTRYPYAWATVNSQTKHLDFRVTQAGSWRWGVEFLGPQGASRKSRIEGSHFADPQNWTIGSQFPGNLLWTWELHPLKLRICMSQTLRSQQFSTCGLTAAPCMYVYIYIYIYNLHTHHTNMCIYIHTH